MTVCFFWLFLCVFTCAFQDFDSDIPEPSDWEKFVAEEYDVLVAEDTASDPPAEG